LSNSNPFPQEPNAKAHRDPLNNDSAPTLPEQPAPSETSEALRKFGILHSEPTSSDAGTCPQLELPVKTMRERIIQAFNYLDTRWDPSQWLGLGAILFHLTDGSERGKDLFEYWSFYYHPDYDDSTGVSPVWEWLAKGGRGTTSMQTIRCFMAAGFDLDQLIPESPICAENEEAPSELRSEEVA
jgi:hypothetical protein